MPILPQDELSASNPELVIPLHSRRLDRARAMQRFQHLTPALTLLVTGVQGIQAGAQGAELALAMLEVATSAVLAVAILRSFRALRKGATHQPHSHGVDWIDVFAAAVIFTEALEQWVSRHHVARPVILMGVVTLIIALWHGKILQRMLNRRALRVGPAGVSFGGRKFQPIFRARWDEIAAIEIGDRDATVVRHDGRKRRINLADLHNAAEVRAAMVEAQRRLPVSLLPSQ